MFCSGPAGGRPEASGVPSLQVTVHWQGLSKCLCRRSRRGPPAGINRKKPSSLWFLRPHVGGEGQLLPTRLFFFFLGFMYLFWLHCIFQLRHVGFSSLATDRSWAHCTGISESSYWTTRKVPAGPSFCYLKNFFGLTERHVGSQFPDQGSNSHPCIGSRVLTAGLPGKSWILYFLKKCVLFTVDLQCCVIFCCTAK